MPLLIVIVGCGRVGARLAATLDAEGHDVRVIDQRSDAFRRLGPEFRGATVVGQGTDEDVLRRAGIEGAAAFAAVTEDDNTNIMAAQVVRNAFHVGKVVTRIYDPIREETYRSLGFQTFCPTELGAQRISELLAAPEAEPRTASSGGSTRS